MKNSNYKKQIKFIFIIVIIVFLINIKVKAKEVNFELVKKVALNAFTVNTGRTNLKIIETIPIFDNNKIVYYIFNFEHGHIVVANDDNVTPVLGYGLKSKIDLDKIPPGLKYLLNNFKNEITYIIRQKFQNIKGISEKWAYYLNLDEQGGLRSYLPETYLLETTWGQQLGYQQYCPKDPKTGSQSVVGCGGVALGQILKYWSCRVFPDNSITYTPSGFSDPITVNFYDQNYQWQNMNLNSSDSDNALLLYHCAVALRSNFGSNGTSSYPFEACNALRTYFGFNADYKNKSSYTSSVWINMLKNNINAGQPIFYAGYNNNTQPISGHGWVIDGYKNDNTFHCNWGWYGNYNTWYLLTDLSPGSDSYNDNQEAVLNIYPLLDACSGLLGPYLICSSNTSYSVSIPPSASVTWSKSSNLIQVGGNTGNIYTVHTANSSQNGTGFVKATIKNSQGNVFLIRNKNIWIGEPKFTIEGDEQLEIRMPGIAMIDYSNGGGNSNNVFWTRSGAITTVNGGPITAKYRAGSRPGMGAVYATVTNTCGSKENRLLVEVIGGWYNIYPNPASDFIYISVDKNKLPNDVNIDNIHFKLYDKMKVLKKQSVLKGYHSSINVSEMKNGIYIIQLITGEKTYEEKIIISK